MGDTPGDVVGAAVQSYANAAHGAKRKRYTNVAAVNCCTISLGYWGRRTYSIPGLIFKAPDFPCGSIKKPGSVVPIEFTLVTADVRRGYPASERIHDSLLHAQRRHDRAKQKARRAQTIAVPAGRKRFAIPEYLAGNNSNHRPATNDGHFSAGVITNNLVSGHGLG